MKYFWKLNLNASKDLTRNIHTAEGGMTALINLYAQHERPEFKDV